MGNGTAVACLAELLRVVTAEALVKQRRDLDAFCGTYKPAQTILLYDHTMVLASG